MYWPKMLSSEKYKNVCSSDLDLQFYVVHSKPVIMNNFGEAKNSL